MSINPKMIQLSAVNPVVAVLIPHRDEQDYRMWSHKARFALPQGSIPFEARGLSLTTLRTQLVRMALGTKATHFFSLDDDVIPPENAINTLLAANLPIVCGLYMAKKKKEERTVSAWMKVQGGYAGISNIQQARYVQVDVCGLGCALIRREIFEKVKEPWFVWEPDGPSEDFYFFDKVSSELGIKPIVDMEVKCLHIGVFSVDVNGEFDTLDA
jgi:hypothetical protein